MRTHISLPEICRPPGRSARRRAAARSGLAPALAALLLLALLSACAGRRVPPPSGPDAPGAEGDVGEGWQQTGVASWYGEPFHGRTTASGERYDQEGLTAAHRSLPFGTWVRVRNLGNGRTVRVRITDRGPFVDGRIIDLSRAAARSLRMIGSGTARVRVTVVEYSGCHAVQVASFSDREQALERRRELEAEGAPVFLESGPGGTTRVLLGPYPERRTAEARRDEHDGWLRSCRDLEGAAGDG